MKMNKAKVDFIWFLHDVQNSTWSIPADKSEWSTHTLQRPVKFIVVVF